MTNERAKAELMQIYGILSPDKQQAIDTAVKPLEQEPCGDTSCQTCKHYGEFSLDCSRCDDEMTQYEPCGDVISRQAVINLIRRCNSALEEPRIFESHHSGNIFERYITELSSVNPQEPMWDRLYNWLNDMRYGIAPDETVTDIVERNARISQTDLLDEIMEWIEKKELTQ